ncbi:hypothetical protein Ataiwa_28560 [Algoriphagus taiwanensis]|uniref:GIY-YIG domain-containing protein n=2 Tax=Algoriphagus taiwanensis TaxID=1445656 RepID=A0ABQ6Q534_9BACT|nr:hypothetical protein Ataiwa_28560 [Algoriphagus taiwanensis]
MELLFFVMAYWVYILYSERLDKYYVGQTSDLVKRVERHNEGKGGFTRTGLPWGLIYSTLCNSRGEAMVLEKKIKNLGAKKFLQILEDSRDV